MNTEYAVGNIRIRFESRARRRWFVALVYAFLAFLDVEGFTVPGRAWISNHAGSGWIVSACLILVVALMIVFSYIAGDMRARGDERETHRRDHAHFKAYWFLAYGLIAALFAGYFQGPNPISPHLPPALQGFLAQLPRMILIATGILYFTLPQAILLWTEPDMEANPEAITQ
jgi:protein-S-isoprenylcysteine O-methyltransferase Ste14